VKIETETKKAKLFSKIKFKTNRKNKSTKC